MLRLSWAFGLLWRSASLMETAWTAFEGREHFKSQRTSFKGPGSCPKLGHFQIMQPQYTPTVGFLGLNAVYHQQLTNHSSQGGFGGILETARFLPETASSTKRKLQEATAMSYELRVNIEDIRSVSGMDVGRQRTSIVVPIKFHQINISSCSARLSHPLCEKRLEDHSRVP